MRRIKNTEIEVKKDGDNIWLYIYPKSPSKTEIFIQIMHYVIVYIWGMSTVLILTSLS